MEDVGEYLMNGACCALYESGHPVLVDGYRIKARKSDTSRKWMLKVAK
jgi:hypothetical protein